MGVTEDTAQKRVSRALDRLRAAFVGRGIVVSGATLASTLSASAVATAPAELASVISGAVSAATSASVATAAGKGIASVLARKLLLGATAAAVAGVAVFGTTWYTHQRERLAELTARADGLTSRITALRERGANATTRRSGIERELARRAAADPANELDAEVAAWFGRVRQLRQLATENPQWSIPEFRLLPERTWFDLARDATFATDADRRELMRKLRDAARFFAGDQLHRALIAYLDAHNGELPLSVSGLTEYLEPAMTPDILDRYEMRAAGNVNTYRRDEWLLAEKAIVDPEHGTRFALSRGRTETATADEIPTGDWRRALQSFAAAHDGQQPSSPAELAPFFPHPLEPVAAKALLAKQPAEFSADVAKQLAKSP